MEKKARVIAYYLPQYHPIPENDKWWGKGFTEWRNVASAKPLFKGHYQPKIPSDLGFYDLRIPEIRKEQAELARNAGIEGFCYWHYWFGHGRQLLERPFKEVLESGTPDFPFCIGWANHDWSNKTWEASSRKTKESVLMKQEYDREDYIEHFNYLVPAFLDDRYIKVDGKPLFVIFSPLDIPDARNFITLWQELAKNIGLKGIHFVAIQQNFSISSKSALNLIGRKDMESISQIYEKVLSLGFDAINSRGYQRAEFKTRNILDFFLRVVGRKIFSKIFISKCQMSKINAHLYTEEDKSDNIYPTLLPNWDRTPRSGKNARVYVGSTPDEFFIQLKKAISMIEHKQAEHKILFLQSWNEWGEGNYVEPDCKYGHGYLDALRDALKK